MAKETEDTKDVQVAATNLRGESVDAWIKDSAIHIGHSLGMGACKRDKYRVEMTVRVTRIEDKKDGD